ncbi:MAG TPA: pantoate--beta-alanine ligase [Candidatus Binataceae bacterium]|nr:pantoate--beta-alanine ligase [Candidatus Binataceae bacterium]
MLTLESLVAMRQWAARARQKGETIALVPTMGALHAGHLSLIQEARKRASRLVVSLFVNPTQFAPDEDLARYPRTWKADLALLESVPVDTVFAPSAEEMYPSGAQTWVEVGELTRELCGCYRPGHFRGVTTVVAKLFNLVQPHVAVFGAKDYQQLLAVRQMVRDLNFDVAIVAMPIVRDADGLALSSRNAYLSADERRRALSLSRGLRAAAALFAQGERNPRLLAAAVHRELASAEVEPQYVEVRDAVNLAAVERVEGAVVVAVAAVIGTTRLIDNVVLGQ